MDITLDELLKGKATIIKGKNYLPTAGYVEPFLERLTKFTDDFRIHVQLPDQITRTVEGDINTDDITYIQNGRVLQSADKDTFLRSFEHLKTPDDTGPLTLEEIMLRTERSEWDDDIIV